MNLSKLELKQQLSCSDSVKSSQGQKIDLMNLSRLCANLKVSLSYPVCQIDFWPEKRIETNYNSRSYEVNQIFLGSNASKVVRTKSQRR